MFLGKFLILASLVFALQFSTLSFAGELIVASWNLEWFFDADTSDNTSVIGHRQAAPSNNEYAWRVKLVAQAIKEFQPDVLGLQEIENLKVVKDISNSLDEQFGLSYEVAFVQGLDTHTGQDVAFIVREGLDFTYGRFEYEHSSPEYKNLSKHLYLDLVVDGEEFTFITVHLIASSQSGRKRQAKTLRSWSEDWIEDYNLILLGDFNTGVTYSRTRPDTEIGHIRGLHTQNSSDDLIDGHAYLPRNQRKTHVSGRQLDRILMSPALLDDESYRLIAMDVRRDLAIRGNRADRGSYWSVPQEERDISDHFPIVAKFSTSGDVLPSARSRMAASERFDESSSHQNWRRSNAGRISHPERLRSRSRNIPHLSDPQRISPREFDRNATPENLNKRLERIEAEIKEIKHLLRRLEEQE